MEIKTELQITLMLHGYSVKVCVVCDL